MRYLASVNMVEETGKDEYAANKITKSLAIPGYEAGVYHALVNTKGIGVVFVKCVLTNNAPQV